MRKRIKTKKRWNYRTSKLENRFAALLKKWGLKYKRQYKIRHKYYDFYLPKYNLLIETDGDYWHGNKKKYKQLNSIQVRSKANDIYKDVIAKVKGYELIRFWEHQIQKTPRLVEKKLFDKIHLIQENQNEN